MKKFSFGQLKSITLYETDEPEYNYDYVCFITDYHLIFPEGYELAGEVNEMRPILISKSNGRIYSTASIDESNTSIFIMIANNLTQLTEIVFAGVYFRSLSRNQDFAQRSAENLTYRKDILELIHMEAPESEPNFWNELLFSEMNIFLY